MQCVTLFYFVWNFCPPSRVWNFTRPRAGGIPCVGSRQLFSCLQPRCPTWRGTYVRYDIWSLNHYYSKATPNKTKPLQPCLRFEDEIERDLFSPYYIQWWHAVYLTTSSAGETSCASKCTWPIEGIGSGHTTLCDLSAEYIFAYLPFFLSLSLSSSLSQHGYLHGKFCLLAFDKFYEKNGQPNQAKTTLVNQAVLLYVDLHISIVRWNESNHVYKTTLHSYFLV